MLTTARMRLVPRTAELTRAEIADRAAFAALLRATVPANWPPDLLADALPWFLQQLETAPDQVGWLDWYGLVRGIGDQPDALVASGGFLGSPQDGTVEVGYSVLPQFQRQGLATEMVAALVDWALAQAGVQQVVAEAHADNTPSVRLLGRLGFVAIGAGREPGHLRLRRGEGSGASEVG
jgi:[ribosomal protein S5]-alanine N-acetyltransferase